MKAKIKKGFLYRINNAFDQVQEPNRIFIFFGIALPGIILAGMPDRVPHYVELSFAGMAYLLVLLFVRMAYIHGWLK